MPLEFKITRDSQVLDQYYELREKCFRSELGLTSFDGSQEEQDKRPQILVALENDRRVVGGVRISSHITLSSQLEELGLNQEMSCMWERFAIDPVMRTLSMFREFSSALIDASRDTGYEHAMVLSSILNARFYRRCHSAIGVKFQIHRHVPHCAEGAFSGLEHYLSVAHLGRGNLLRAAAL